MQKLTLDDIIKLSECEVIHTLNGKIMALEEELAEVTEQRDLVVADRSRIIDERNKLREENEKLRKSCEDVAYGLQYLEGFRYAIELVYKNT